MQPVVEAKEYSKLVGIVTDHDVCGRISSDDQRASEVSLDNVLRSLRRFYAYRAASLPVTEKAGN